MKMKLRTHITILTVSIFSVIGWGADSKETQSQSKQAQSAQKPPRKLEDWQTSLKLFIEHVEQVRVTPSESSKVSMLDKDSFIYFGMLLSQGGCAGKTPTDEEFGPRVRFAGRFDKIVVNPEPGSGTNHRDATHKVVLKFPETSPGSIIHVYPAESDISNWERVTSGSDAQFEADLNCLIGASFPNGKTVYSLTLKNAQLVSDRGKQ